MGKRQRRQRRRQNKDSQGEKRGAGYADISMNNEAFEHYYKEQKLVPEGEWDQFMSILRTNLPVAFRITGFRGQSNQVLRYLKGECFSELFNSDSEEAVEARPIPIPWYPDELAWQLNLSRSVIRKMPALGKLHEFLISETESGNISRQEAVSMIPPLLLKVKPHHRVLDMCAAPGSKTAQLIEMVHAEQTLGWPEGFVIGNDDDNRRCYIMVHQAKRLNSPCCMVVNHDASVFPRLQVPGPDGQMASLQYDRVLCDVPCGGDGTLRKNYAIWKKWSPLSGFNLHPLQQRILLRGVELLAVGGRLVYSTCSFNPVENEAVLANVIKQSQGAVELVDVSDELVGLDRQPGLTAWKVINEKAEEFGSVEDVPEDKRRRYKQSFWPPPEEEAKAMNLPRCVRILPHHQNTGGFFVAVLRKTKPLPWVKQEKSTTQEDQETSNEQEQSKDAVPDTTGQSSQEEKTEDPTNATTDGSSASPTNEPPAKKRCYGGYKEDPFVFFKEDADVWPQIKEYYKIEDSFPITQVLTRCHVGKKRNLYLTNKTIKDILQHNEDKLKVINSGVKVWSRSDAKDVPCDFRLTQEGINVLYPFLNERKLTVTRDEIVTLLSEENPITKQFSEETQEMVDKMGQGTLVLTYYPKTESNQEEADSPFILIAWRGKTSLRSYISKGYRQHILRMCGAPVQSIKIQRTKAGSSSSASVENAADAGTVAVIDGGDDLGGGEEEDLLGGDNDARMDDDIEEDGEPTEKEELDADEDVSKKTLKEIEDEMKE